MDNSFVSVSASIATGLALGALALKCIDSVENYTPHEVITNPKPEDAKDIMTGHINTKIEHSHAMPSTHSLHMAANGGSHIVSPSDHSTLNSRMSSVDHASAHSLGVSHCALNQPAPTLASSLLPLPVSDQTKEKWADPSCVSNALANQNMLSALDLIGVNTVASSLKNASQDLRGDPLCNPRDPVTVFNNSSIACTFNRPLTCYDSDERPTLWSCDWNKQWWEGIEGVKPSEPAQLKNMTL